MNGAPTIVVFDVGNVLIRWDPMLLFASLFPDEDERAWFTRNVCTAAWNIEFDRGRPFADGIVELVAKYPQHEAAIRAFDTRWHDMVPGAIDENVAVLESLRVAGVPDYAVTNFSREKWAEAKVRFPFLAEFKGTIVSAHERVIKPDPAIFRLLLDRYGLSAADCVFIDDSAKNIATAARLGFDVVHVTATTDLAAELKSRGLPAG